MAEAVKNLFPNAKVAIGPAIDDGFYYDFDFKTPISEDDLPKIEDEMRRIIKANTQYVEPNFWESNSDRFASLKTCHKRLGGLCVSQKEYENVYFPLLSATKVTF